MTSSTLAQSKSIAFSFASFTSILLVAASGLLSVGCSSAAEANEAGHEGMGEDELTRNKVGDDVTVLQAWIGETVGRENPGGPPIGDKALDLKKCSKSDCTTAAQDILDSVLAGPFKYEESSSGKCETYEIRTAIRESAFDAPTFIGIGFHLSTSVDHVFNLVAKRDLLARGKVGEVRLRDGSKALVHKFVAQGTCFGLGGNGGSISERKYDFKPYAQFNPSRPEAHKVWDSVPNDYRLGRADDGGWVASFDRRSELLSE